MDVYRQIVQKWAEYFESNNFVKLTLSKPISKSSALKNVYIRKTQIKGETSLQWTFRYKTQDITKNYNWEESVEQLTSLLEEQFRAVSLFSLEEDAQFLISKKGKLSSRTAAPTFKEIPPEVNDRQKEKRLSLDKPFLFHLGITDDMGNLIPKMADKYRQINKYLEIVEGLLGQANLSEKSNVVDMGSGKGYLTFALYDYLVNTCEMDIEMFGVELREELVDFCNDVAQKCDFDNLSFVAERIENFELEKIDILIALHACDTATDDALFKAIQAKSSLIICAPCCHKQLRQQVKGVEQEDPLLKFGIFKERTFEMLTDTIRAILLEKEQYKTKIFEFVSNEHTRKNIMMVGVKTRKKANLQALEEKLSSLKDHYQLAYHYLEKKIQER
jgi:SAM-dependent methyltransferase